MLFDGEKSGRRDAERMFVGSMLGILASCAIMLWATGLIGDVAWPMLIFLSLALIVVALVGTTLMMLVFYSSRTADEPPTYVVPDEAAANAKASGDAGGTVTAATVRTARAGTGRAE